jgi:hypothetical protein
MSKDCTVFLFRVKQENFDPEKEGAPSLQNVDYYLPINTVQHPRRHETSYNEWLKCILLNVMNLESLHLVPK